MKIFPRFGDMLCLLVLAHYIAVASSQSCEGADIICPVYGVEGCDIVEEAFDGFIILGTTFQTDIGHEIVSCGDGTIKDIVLDHEIYNGYVVIQVDSYVLYTIHLYAVTTFNFFIYIHINIDFAYLNSIYIRYARIS